MNSALNDQSLDQIFRSAHTFNGWADRPVEDATVTSEANSPIPRARGACRPGASLRPE